MEQGILTSAHDSVQFFMPASLRQTYDSQLGLGDNRAIFFSDSENERNSRSGTDEERKRRLN